MATLGEFLSPAAGQQRRKWLDETLGYYLPPELRGWVGAGAELNPVTNMERAGTAAQRVADPSLGGWDRMAAAGDMAVNMGAVLAPVAGAKLAGTAGVDGANAIVEALTAASPMKGAVDDFLVDEFGGMRVWTGGVGDPIKAASDRGAWFAETPDLAKEYAGQGGRVLSAEIDPRKPIMFRHAEQRRPIGDVISTALEGAGEGANFEAARPIVERLSQRYGQEPRALFEYWNNDKDVADLFRALGYDAISAAEKSDMKAATWAALDPSIVRMEAADPIASRGAQIMDMLRSGRGADVTDEMLDMGDATLNARLNEWLFNNYDLPMDAASRSARAGAMGMDTAAYHATRSDAPFSSFRPGVRGSVYMAATPQGAEAGASGQILEDYGAGAVRAVLPLNVNSQDVAGLSVNRAAFDVLPEKITDEATIKEIAPRVRQAGLQYWDDAYEAVPFGDEYRYYKREVPAVSYQDVEPGKDAFGYRLGGFNSGSDVAALDRVRDQGRHGFLVADEGGSSIVAAPDMPIRSRFARFDPRLAHLRNLSASIGLPLAVYLGQDPETLGSYLEAQ